MKPIALPAGPPAGLQGYLRRKALPPVEDWPNLPGTGHCGDSFMRIARDGTWFHQGSPIGRPELVRLFSTLLRKDEDGFVLVTPGEKLSIQVEDAPFIAVLMEVEGSGAAQSLRFTTNVGDAVAAGAQNRLTFKISDGAPVPYLHVRRGLTAKAARPVYYQLADLAVTHRARAGVWSDGIFFAFDSA